MYQIGLASRATIFFVIMIALTALGYYFYPDQRDKTEWISLWVLSLTSTGVTALIALGIIDIFLRQQASKNETNRRKADFTVAMYNQFQSQEMVRSRNVAKYICESFVDYKGLSFEQMSIQMFHQERDEVRRNMWVSFSSLIHFYSQLGVLIKLGLIDEDMARQLFLDYFHYLFKTDFIQTMIEATRASGEPAFWLNNIEYLIQHFDS